MGAKIIEGLITSLVYISYPVIYCAIILLLITLVQYLFDTKSRYTKAVVVGIVAISLVVFGVTINAHVWNGKGPSGTATTSITNSSGKIIGELDVVLSHTTNDNDKQKIIGVRDLQLGSNYDVQFIPFTMKDGKVSIIGAASKYSRNVETAIKDMGYGSYTGTSLGYAKYDKLSSKHYIYPLGPGGFIFGFIVTFGPAAAAIIEYLRKLHARKKNNLILKTKLNDI